MNDHMKKYKIKSFAKHMGVTLDTVKHYQNCGILKPIVDPANNYRHYNITHGERLIVSRKFRNLGFSLEDTSAMISKKNGTEMKEMLEKRKAEIEQELKRLQNNYESICHLDELCELFNNNAETYDICERPAFYLYRHTYNFEFIENNASELLTKDLMEQLPNAVKMLIVPYDTLKSRTNKNFYHGIGIQKCYSSYMDQQYIQYMESIPSASCVRYIYSRPFSHNKYEAMDDIYEQLKSTGISLTKSDIIIENAIDYYKEGTRYENYIIYFPLD